MKSSWKTVKLSEIAMFNPRESIKKGTLAKKIPMDKLIPFCRDIPEYTMEEFKSGTKFRNNDTIMARITPCLENGKIAKVNILEDEEVGFGSTEYIVFRSIEGISDPDFLYYLVCSSIVKEPAIKSMVGSSGRQRVQADVLKNLEVSIPPIEEQIKIGKLLKQLDDKIEINNKINNNLIEIAMQLYKNWFLDFIPFSTNSNIPNGWKLGKISDIVNILDSKRKPISGNVRDKMKKIYPYYGAASLMDYVDDYLFDGVYLLLGEDGTVMDSNGFPILQYVEGKFWVNNHAHILEGKNGFSVEMLFLLFSLTNIKSIVTGAVQPKISQSNLKNIDIFIPPKDVLYEFDTIIQPVFSKIRSLRNANKILSNIRDSLITNLLSGKIDVSNIDI